MGETGVNVQHMLYFNTLVFLKIETYPYQRQVVVHGYFNMVKIIGIEYNLDDSHGVVCFSTEANISRGGGLP